MMFKYVSSIFILLFKQIVYCYFLQSGNTDQKVITYFMSSDDANKYVNELSQTNGAKEVRIMATSLEKVFECYYVLLSLVLSLSHCE